MQCKYRKLVQSVSISRSQFRGSFCGLLLIRHMADSGKVADKLLNLEELDHAAHDIFGWQDLEFFGGTFNFDPSKPNIFLHRF